MRNCGENREKTHNFQRKLFNLAKINEKLRSILLRSYNGGFDGRGAKALEYFQ